MIATAKNGRELLRLLEILDTDVVLMDIDMPVMNGIETMQAIKNSNKSCKVIILTMHEESALVKKMTDSGAKGYLFKNSDKEELLLAIKRVHEGGVFFAPSGFRKDGKRPNKGKQCHLFVNRSRNRDS